MPLDNLDTNVRCIDALIDWPVNGSTPPDHEPKTERSRTPWPRADVITGNPPFLGAKRLKPERGAAYVNAVRKAYPTVPGMADYCVFWINRAHQELAECTADDPFSGRGGLVGTQNIRNNKSREGGLDHVVRTGTIVEAVDNQPWSGEANVHVSIVNWVKHAPPMPKIAGATYSDDGFEPEKLFIPEQKKLWFKVEPTLPLFEEPGGAKRRAPTRSGGRGSGRKYKSYELSYRETTKINSALSDQTDVSEAAKLKCNQEPKRVFQGVTPGHAAFVLTSEERNELLQDRVSGPVVHPYLVGRELVTGAGMPERFLIDLSQYDVFGAKTFTGAYKRVEGRVLPERIKNVEDDEDEIRPHHKQFLDRWWKLAWDRSDLLAALDGIPRFLVISRVSKRPIFVFISSDIRPGDALQAFTFADDYSFGILQSDAHWQWYITKCSKLTERFRYTPESVFDTFPWPQKPTSKQIDAIAEAGREVRRIRAEALKKVSGGLRAIYRMLELPGKNPLRDAHAALDAAVLDAYGFDAKKDLLKQLLDLNRAVADRIRRGDSVVAPGIPPSYPEAKRAELVTDDCIRAD